jgi:hypothetical protein
MVDINQLFEICPPPRSLTAEYSQYVVEIQRLQAIKNGAVLEPIKRRGGNDLARYVEFSLLRKDIASFTPFELLTRIHSRGITKDEQGKTLEYEESAPIHYGPYNNRREIIVRTNPSLRGEIDLNTAYNKAVVDTLRRYAPELKDQKLTTSDVITINRRLIEKNIRCIPCVNHKVTCFKYDWLTRSLL